MTVQHDGTSAWSTSSNRELTGATVFQNAGTINWTAGNVGSNSGDFTFTNQVGGNLNVDLANAQAFGALNGTKAFDNAGTLTKTGVNYLDVQMPMHNSGTIDLQQNKLEWRGGTNTGAVTIAAGAELRMPIGLSGGFVQSAGGAISGDGTVTFYSIGVTPVAFSDGTYDVGATNAWHGAIDFDIAAQTGSLSLANLYGQPGSRLGGSGSLTVTGAMTWTGNGGWPDYYTGISGSLTVDAQGGLTMDGSDKVLLDSAKLRNSGAAVWSAGNLVFKPTGGSTTTQFVNLEGGTLDLQFDPANSGGGTAATNQFINVGGWTKSGGTGTATFSSVTVSNTSTGSFTVSSGSVKFDQPFSNSGTITIETGTFTVQAADYTQTAGSLLLNSGNVATVSGGSFLINGGVMRGTSGTVDAPVTVGAAGTIGGNLTINGATSISGTHAPGNSAGILTHSANLTYQSGAIVAWELFSNSVGTRGTDFDGIDLTGSAEVLFAASPITLALAFDAAGSAVDWSDTFWAVDHLTTSGWLLYDLDAGSLSGLENLTLTTSLDSLGNALGSIRPGASFGLFQSGNDVYVTYSSVPEPAFAAFLLAAGSALLGVIGRKGRGKSTEKGATLPG